MMVTPRLRSLTLWWMLVILSAALVTHAQEPPPATKSAAGPAEAFRGLGKDILLEVDPKGEILWTYDQQTQQFESLTAKIGVHFKSESMDLHCDKLVYTGKDEKMIATGSPVLIRQGSVNASCGRLEYTVSDRRSVLTENPKILNEGEKGEWTSTLTGNTIILIQDEQGKTSILSKGEGKKAVRFALTPAEKPQPEEKKPQSSGAVEINNQNLDKIREVEISK
jgi:lipopolysaccharide export system protein LptA